LYCWNCEMIKNLLLDFAVRINSNLRLVNPSSFLTMYPFMVIMNGYKSGKYTYLFSEIDVGLRNSFAHGKVNFLNDKVVYYDSQGEEKSLKLTELLSKYKKIPALYGTLFAYRMKAFSDELKNLAKKQGLI